MNKYLINLLILSSAIFASDKAVTFSKTYGGIEHDIAKSVVKTDDGYLIAGKSRSFSKDRYYNAYLIKIDKNGDKIWSKIYGGEDNDEARAITRVGKDFVFVGSTESYGNDDLSYYFVKIDKDGKIKWEKTYYRGSDDEYYGNDIVSDGKNLVIAGTERHLNFFSAKINPLLFKVDSEGDLVWRGYYGGKDEDYANAIISVKDGYLMAGTTETYGHGDFDSYIVKLNKEGKREWFHAYGGKDDETANDIIETDDGYLIVGSTDSFGLNYKDVFVVRVDRRGKVIWRHSYGGRYDDEAFGVAKSPDGGFVIVGRSEVRREGSQLYLLKINGKGKVEWSRTYGGDEDDAGYDIVTADDGYLIVGEKKTDIRRDSNVWVLKVDFKGRI
jgi:hypothetical protein